MTTVRGTFRGVRRVMFDRDNQRGREAARQHRWYAMLGTGILAGLALVVVFLVKTDRLYLVPAMRMPSLYTAHDDRRPNGFYMLSNMNSEPAYPINTDPAPVGGDGEPAPPGGDGEPAAPGAAAEYQRIAKESNPAKAQGSMAVNEFWAEHYRQKAAQDEKAAREQWKRFYELGVERGRNLGKQE